MCMVRGKLDLNTCSVELPGGVRTCYDVVASFPGRSRLQFMIASSIKMEGEGPEEVGS